MCVTELIDLFESKFSLSSEWEAFLSLRQSVKEAGAICQVCLDANRRYLTLIRFDEGDPVEASIKHHLLESLSGQAVLEHSLVAYDMIFAMMT